MTASATTDARALLPNGLRDVLPPDAAFEAATVERLTAVFAAHGYDRVKPPLIEFEDALLSGSGVATAGQTFRVMDPISQRMMGLRADITLQVARIATTRLRKAPRPLRLTYAGQVLRVKGTQLRPERQFTQTGVELIGAGGAEANSEVLLLAVAALAEAGVEKVTVDLNLPPLVPALCADLGIVGETADTLRRCLEQKDVATVRELAGEAAAPFLSLAKAVGPAEAALPVLEAMPLSGAAAGYRDTLVALARGVMAAAPEVDVTVDPLEHKGFEYHTGAAFALFARGARGELARGGEYVNDFGAAPESCTGVTLYMDSILGVLTPPADPRRVLVPADMPMVERQRLQAEGWVTIPFLPVAGAAGTPAAEAARLGCGHYWDGAAAVAAG